MKLRLLSAITLLLMGTSSPLLTHAKEVTIQGSYTPFFLNGMNYKDNNGIAQPGLEWDVTAKMLIKNNSVNVNMNTFHYIHFWDSSDAYLGHYATSTAESCNSVCLGVLPPSISTSYAIPLPPTAHTFALGRYDRADANYEISNGVTIEEFFESQTNYYENNNIAIDELAGKTLNEVYTSINLSENHDITDSYWKTNGTVSSLNNYYYAVGKNLFDMYSLYKYGFNGNLNPNNTVFIYNPNNEITISNIFKPNTSYTIQFKSRKVYANANITTTFSYTDGSNILVNHNMTSTTEFNYFSRSSVSGKTLNTIRITNGLNGESWKSELDLSSILLEEGSTATTYESFITPTISINLTDLGLSSLTKTQVDNYFFNFYEYNRTSTFGFTSGVFSYITEDYYADDVREFVWNLTKIFGAGNEPSAVDIGNYETYYFWDENSTITETAWRNQRITYNVSYWDDGVGASVSNGFMLIASLVVTFVLMMFGFKTRARIFNVLAIAGTIWFTIQAGANLPLIILGVGLIIVNGAFLVKMD